MSSQLLELIEKTLDEKQAENIVEIDMSSVNPFTDTFVICTARNIRHAASLIEFCEQEAEKNGYSVRVREGEKESTWMLLDLDEVVIHVFTDEARKLYRLEALWADLPQVSYQEKAIVENNV